MLALTSSTTMSAAGAGTTSGRTSDGPDTASTAASADASLAHAEDGQGDPAPRGSRSAAGISQAWCG